MPDQPGWGIDGDTEDAERRLHAFAAAMVDLRPFWPKVVPLFIGWMRKQFETEGVFWLGRPWQPLTPAYAARKAAEHPGRGLLVAEGDLRRGASTPRRTVTPRSITFTIDWPKEANKYTAEFDPAWHHLGEGNNPRRPLLSDGLPPQAMLELENAVDEYVEETARRLGL